MVDAMWFVARAVWDTVAEAGKRIVFVFVLAALRVCRGSREVGRPHGMRVGRGGWHRRGSIFVVVFGVGQVLFDGRLGLEETLFQCNYVQVGWRRLRTL